MKKKKLLISDITQVLQDTMECFWRKKKRSRNFENTEILSPPLPSQPNLPKCLLK